MLVTVLNNNLAQQPTFIYDSTGKITGYKTTGGADSVFPFSKLQEIQVDARNDDIGISISATTINAIRNMGYTKVYLYGIMKVPGINSNFGMLNNTYNITSISGTIVTGGSTGSAPQAVIRFIL